MRRIGCLAVLFAVCLAPSSAPAQGWETVGTGIEYRQFTLPNPDPNNVFVSRMDRANLQATIESSIGQGQLASGRETVSGMASRYDQAISYWGQAWGGRNDVVVAINGDFFEPTTGVPEGGQIHSGWYAKRFNDVGGRSGFAWRIDRTPFLGQCITHRTWKQFITFLDTATTQEFQGINRDPGSNELVVYTPQYDATTDTDSSGVEVVVEMSRPSLVLPTPSMARGFVREIRDLQGSSYIPFDHVILSATGSSRSTLLSNIQVGDEIGISQEITNFLEQDCSTPLPGVSWTKTFASIGGNFTFLRDGVVQSSSDPGLTARNPRTAICFNDTYVYFVVVDGRDPGTSVGMTITELGIFARDTLGATQCINQDGGGSSTMLVNGVVKNNPSDGSERTVANGMMMVVVEPVEKSTALAPGNAVTTAVPTTVRLGPGTNYEARASVSQNTSGTVLDHISGLNGVLAKGSHWWKVALGTLVGWVPEESFVPPGRVGGTVTDAGTGLPLAGVTVNVWSDAEQLLASATTGVSGAYLVEGVSAGTRFVTTADTPAYADELYDNLPCDPSCSVTSGNAVTVASEATTSGIDFALSGIADLSITKTDGRATAIPGTAITYTIVASNAGPSVASGATVTDTVPAEITGVTWTCVAGGGASCTASGSGSINETVDLPAGGSVTYTLTGTVSAAARGSLGNTATVAAPAGVTDPDRADNSATDTDTLLGLGLFTLAPCRVIDTRGGSAPIGGPVMQGQETRVFAVVGYCGLPPTAKALSINVAVTLPSAAGNIRLFPAGLPVPTFSNLNYVAGQTRSNNAIVSLNDSGELAAFVGQPAGTTTHVIVDVNGYFE